MDSQEIKKDNPHSVEFSITSKGLWSGKVKAYAQTPNTAMVEALAIAEKIQTICKGKNEVGLKFGTGETNGKLT